MPSTLHIANAFVSTSQLRFVRNLQISFHRQNQLCKIRRIAMSTVDERGSSNAFRKAYGPWAVVTGASSGIGAEFARQLAGMGFNIVAVARREDRLRVLCDGLERAAGVNTRIIVADLSTEIGVNTVCTETENVDVGLLINNAGIAFRGPFTDVPLSGVRTLMAVNASAVAQLANVFAVRLCKRGRGGIIFVSSMSANGVPYAALYSASKAFVTCLALALRPELAKAGVECMSLEPGFVRSEMTLGIDEKGDPTPYTGMIDVDYCVRDSLAVFGTKPVYTPGFLNRLFKNIVLALPRPLIMRLWVRFLGL